ncbi:DUF4352 domain-containing protein [Streptomyces sp. NPDC056291]|uniref:DUF4352 domain-containing protein n=1 Tax=Streptomyces sp. NPDC056291 TaxID=3345772 RepID=UPI0035E1D7C8
MRAFIRGSASAVLLCAVLTACSGADHSDDRGSASKPPPAVQDAGVVASEEPPSSKPAPVLSVGQTGTWDYGETDDNGENFQATSKMQVTVVSAKYATPAEAGTTNEPEHGQYVILTLTLKNVGQAPAKASMYGLLRWEDEQTAAQDCTTLEGVGEGDDLDTTYKPGQSVTGKLVLDVGRRGGVVSYVGTDDPDADAAFQVTLPK